MSHDESDAELLRRARAGADPAFAVLVYRYASLLYAATPEAAAPRPAGTGSEEIPAATGVGDPEALAKVRRTFLRAMRRLDRADDNALGTWLLELQGTPMADGDAEGAAPLATAELDRLWGQLAPCWPRGRRSRRPPRWLGHVAVVALLLALSVAVPYALLVTAVDEEEDPVPMAEVVAVPIPDDEFDLSFEDESGDAAGAGRQEADAEGAGGEAADGSGDDGSGDDGSGDDGSGDDGSGDDGSGDDTEGP